MPTTVLKGDMFHYTTVDRLVRRQGLHDGSIDCTTPFANLDTLVAKEGFSYNGFERDVARVKNCIKSGLWPTPEYVATQFKEEVQIMRNKQVAGHHLVSAAIAAMAPPLQLCHYRRHHYHNDPPRPQRVHLGDRTFSKQLVRLDAMVGKISYNGFEADFEEANRYAIGE